VQEVGQPSGRLVQLALPVADNPYNL